MSTIPDDWRERSPRMTLRAWEGLSRVLQHADAPRWNRTMGDRVGDAELEALAAFRAAVAERPLESERDPSPALAAWLDALRDRVPRLRALPQGFDAARDFEHVPTCSREDVVRRLEHLVPLDADLDQAVVYTTSGTTGHPVMIPSHPGAMAKHLAHLERVAQLHGVALDPREGEPFAANVGYQRATYVFATTLSAWRGAVLAKLNIAPHEWAGGEPARGRFLREFAPTVVASEPVTLAEMVRAAIPVRPRIIVSSAVTLHADLARAVTDAFGAPVVDVYSATETGPIGATVPGLPGHVVLLPDLYVEALDEQGERVPDGERGEITLTGGRNPYLPLVRYRTGDYGRLATVALPDGRRARAILDLEGRAPVVFRGADGRPVNSVDVARALRPVGPFVQHAFLQRGDGSIELRVRPVPNVPVPLEGMEHVLRELFGDVGRVEVVADPELGSTGGKVVAWRRE